MFIISGDKDVNGIIAFNLNGDIVWRIRNMGSWTSVTWSPERPYFAALAARNPDPDHSALYIIDKQGRILRKIILPENRVGYGSWSRDGNYLVIPNGNNIIVYSVDYNELARLTLNESIFVVEWSPNQSLIAYGAFESKSELGVLTLLMPNATLLIQGPVGTRISISSNYTYYNIIINSSINNYIKLPPGNYTIEYQIPVPSNFVGNKEIFSNKYKITIKSSTKYLLKIPDISDLTGRILINAPPRTIIDVLWDNSSASYTVPENSTLTLYASPGEYNISYTISENIIGNVKILRNSTIVSVNTGKVVKVNIPEPKKNLGYILIKGFKNLRFMITWQNNYRVLSLPDNGTLKLCVAPGRYHILYNISVLGEGIEQITINASISPGKIYTINLRNLTKYLTELIIRVPPRSLLEIEWSTAWGTGSRNFELNNGSIVLWLASGDYTLKFIKKTRSFLYSERVYNLHVDKGGVYTIEFDKYNHSNLYYILLFIFIILIYFSIFHPFIKILNIYAPEGIIKGNQIIININIIKFGLIPIKQDVKVELDGKIFNLGSVRLTLPRKYQLKIILQHDKKDMLIQ